jgi:transposase InsO family protein
VSRKRVIRLMQEQGLVSRPRKKFVVTTDSNHALEIAPNVLDRDFTASGPNQKWAGDVTYLKTPEGWLYLAIVIDLFSRFIVGWAVSTKIDRHLVLAALDMAQMRRGKVAGVLFHSDRGSQYASEDHRKALVEGGFTCSMSRRGSHDNAVSESWFSTLPSSAKSSSTTRRPTASSSATSRSSTTSSAATRRSTTSAGQSSSGTRRRPHELAVRCAALLGPCGPVLRAGDRNIRPLRPTTTETD